MWGVNSDGYIYEWDGTDFVLKSTSPQMKFVAIGGDGTIGAADTSNYAYLWTGTS